MELQTANRTSRESVEQTVIAIWRQVLELPDVQLDDDFFFLGGDSLKAVELMMSVEEVYGILLDPAEILERTTVREFAAAIFDLLSDGGTAQS